MSENQENQDILNDTTEEIVLGTSENENENETNEIVGPVQVHEPVIQIIDLVSETGSEKNGNDDWPENLRSQVPSALYRRWHRGINPEDTSTPTSEPTRVPAKEPFDIRIEYLQRFVIENEGFHDLCGQPGAEWPGILGKKGLRKEYERVYNYAERNYPEVLRYNDYPHPSVIERDVPNFRMARSPERFTDRADSGGADIGADLRRFFTERRRSQSAATGHRSSDQQESPRPRFANLVRPSPPTHQLPPRPSTSTGALSWQETKQRLLPLNQASKKLVSEEFAREIEVSKILEFKPSFEDHEGIHDVVNNAIRNHVGRRQRFLEAYKKIQDQMEQHLGEIDPNPGRYEYKPDETEEQTGESLPVASMHRSVSTEQQGITDIGYYQNGPCTPQCCVCNDDKCI
jgi:hypothetical protein